MTRKAAIVLSAALSTLGLGAAAQAAPLLSDTFTYSDGPLETVSGGVWEINSGSGSKVVSAGRFVIDDNTTSDYQRQFNAGATSTLVYSSFTLNMDTLDIPNSVGAYFVAVAGPKSGTTFSTLFRNRVGAFISGSEGAGKFTLAISSAGGSPNIATDYTAWGTALNLGTDYTIVIKYDASTGENRLWVNPTLESDTSVVNIGATSTTGLGSFLWRSNSSSIDGDKTVDNLNVGTLFADVVGGGGPTPEPTTAGVLAAAGIAALLRRRRESI
ncbi:hypothetical protein BH09PLA1_BH09PLA1_03650 [soil metagenome]